MLVRGRRCPVLGRVTMDQTMIDLSALPTVEAGEEVVLIGRQEKEEILAAELAAKAGTISWEIFTGLTARVGRVLLRLNSRFAHGGGRHPGSPEHRTRCSWVGPVSPMILAAINRVIGRKMLKWGHPGNGVKNARRRCARFFPGFAAQ